MGDLVAKDGTKRRLYSIVSLHRYTYFFVTHISLHCYDITHCINYIVFNHTGKIPKLFPRREKDDLRPAEARIHLSSIILVQLKL